MGSNYANSQKSFGFTIIEVLFALLLTGAILSAAAVIAVQSAKAGQSARRTVEELNTPLQTMDQFETDVQNMITWLPREVKALDVAHTEGALLELNTLTDWPDPQLALRRRYPSRVRYRLEKNAGLTDGLNLVREIDDLTDNAEPRTHIVAERLVGGDLEALVKEKWITAPSPTDEVRAVRLTLTWKDAPAGYWVRIAAVPRVEGQK